LLLLARLATMTSLLSKATARLTCCWKKSEKVYWSYLPLENLSAAIEVISERFYYLRSLRVVQNRTYTSKVRIVCGQHFKRGFIVRVGKTQTTDRVYRYTTKFYISQK
jgi:hypothetical protein